MTKCSAGLVILVIVMGWMLTAWAHGGFPMALYTPVPPASQLEVGPAPAHRAGTYKATIPSSCSGGNSQGLFSKHVWPGILLYFQLKKIEKKKKALQDNTLSGICHVGCCCWEDGKIALCSTKINLRESPL